MTIQQRMEKVIRESLSIKKEDIHLSSNLIEDLFADDLDNIEIVLALEEEFSISITDEIMAKVETVKDLLEIVKKGLTLRSS